MTFHHRLVFFGGKQKEEEAMSELISVSLFEHFSPLPDPRIDRTKRHVLLDIIGLSICAVICGADGWEAIEEYGDSKSEWLHQFLELPHGIPSDDTIRRVFTRLSPTRFQECFQEWIQAIATRTGGQVISVDGKPLRRSYDRRDNKAALHMVSAWASANRLILGQLKTEEKSNEITAIPKLLRILALEGCIVTIDAMGCQTAIATQIIEQGADYVLALKGNQGTVHDKVVEFFDHFQGPKPEAEPEAEPEPEPEPEPKQKQASPQKREHQQKAWEQATACYETVDGDHGRIEIRRYWQVSDVTWLDERSQWKHLQSIGMVEAERHVGDQVSVERRYYLSSLAPDVIRFAEAVRGHWGIENSVPWVLDVAFREDESRIRKGFAPANFAVLRHIALNVLRQDTRCPRGIPTKRLKAGWDEAYLTHLLAQAGGETRSGTTPLSALG
jgi:predicted transposase YbfD/YdcC